MSSSITSFASLIFLISNPSPLSILLRSSASASASASVEIPIGFSLLREIFPENETVEKIYMQPVFRVEDTNQQEHEFPAIARLFGE